MFLTDYFFFTEQVGLAVTLQMCIWEVLGSNLGRGSISPVTLPFGGI
jgi:hypothetical protein